MTNKDLVNNLVKDGVLKTGEYINAFLKIDRINFVPEELKPEAYDNNPLSIGKGQTISQPWTVAFMIELLGPEKGDKILDIGSGSGWQTAILAYIVGNFGKVIAVERIPELAEFGKKNILKNNFIKKGIIEFICKDGSKPIPAKFIPAAGFDRIILAASALNIPEVLFSELKNGGILVGVERNAVVRIFKNSKGELKKEKFHGFSFVPLIED